METQSKSSRKITYKITNWKSYEDSLKKRGEISFWLNPKLLAVWKDIDVRKTAVGEQTYPDSIIEFCLTMKTIYHLAYRQTTGFVANLLALHGLENACVPDHSTLCRRAKDLPVSYCDRLNQKKDRDILVDSTGIKVSGEGEWKVRKHGASKRRTWLKLHLAIDADTQEIVANCLTDNSIDDAHAAKEMLEEQAMPLRSLAADGAYDKFFFREFLGVDVLQKIPPPCNAVLKMSKEKVPIAEYLVQRNQAVERIKEVGAKQWKQEIGYHRRSLVETAMFRYKRIFGDKASSRRTENQRTEASIKCKILNQFTKLGMPKTIKIFKN